MYKSLAEKKEFFEDGKIVLAGGSWRQTKGFYICDEWEPLLLRIEHFKRQNDYLFRGVNEAKYRLYTSLQVKWAKLIKDKKLCDEYVHYSIQQMLNNRKFCSHLKHGGMNINEQELLILAILQHYGKPTPLMDFSYDIDHALFFAIDGMKNEQKAEIDDYCSLYIIDHLGVCWPGSYQQMLINAGKDITRAVVSELIKGSGPIQPGNKDAFTPKYDNVKDISALALEGPRFGVANIYSFFKSDSIVISNPRIKEQDGLFILNTTVDTPLEKYGRDWWQEPVIICININKKLQPQIQKYLAKNNITHDMVYLKDAAVSQLYEQWVEESQILSPEDWLTKRI